MKTENINLEEQTMEVIKSKTEAGVRTIPIADKILPFVKYFYNSSNDYLLTMKTTGRKYQYRNYKDAYWLPVLDSLNMEHKPHDTRHTFISMMAAAEIDERIIKAIVGHAGSGVTEIVYTHIPMRKMLEAVNQL